MSNNELVCERIAELWTLNQGRKLTEVEMDEMYICMKANAKYYWEKAYRENMSLMESMIPDIDYQDERLIDAELWTQYNLSRSAYYKNPTEENEAKMDQAYKNYFLRNKK